MSTMTFLPHCSRNRATINKLKQLVYIRENFKNLKSLDTTMKTRFLDGQYQHLKKIEKEIKSTLKKNDQYKYILSIPGIGYISAAVFIGEIGSIEKFSNHKRLVKYIGFAPVSHIDNKKNGSKLLKKYLYTMSQKVAQKNLYFKTYYDNKLKNNLTKKEAMCALSIKLIKVIYSLVKNKREFEPNFGQEINTIT